ncbi:serine/threonine-protein phosphatase [candidate division KSB1 bacterium]|nr:serine/threonine-protein phosphatase [candidate division KSB1 bacterium]
MPTQTTHTNTQSFHKQKLGKTIINDIKSKDFKRNLFQDVKDIYHFYLDEDTKERLKKMPPFKRWLFVIWWMLRSMFFKLTPVRRILFVIGIVLIFTLRTTVNNGRVQSNTEWLALGIGILVIVLMLELKDKLLVTDELMIGRKVQFALLPDKSPIIPGWEVWMYTQPANEVGGDLVDYLEYCDNRWGLALGDVAGKGLGAALLMAKLQATYRALAPNFESLDQLGSEMNRIFRRDGISNRFISFAYFIISPNANVVKVLNAGQLPPLLIQKKSIRELESHGQAFGIMNDPVYEEQTISFNTGDTLIIFSDGLIEARSEKGEFLGEAWVKAKLIEMAGLPAPIIGSQLLDAVKRYVGNARAHDDLSVIIMRYVGK